MEEPKVFVEGDFIIVSSQFCFNAAIILFCCYRYLFIYFYFSLFYSIIIIIIMGVYM